MVTITRIDESDCRCKNSNKSNIRQNKKIRTSNLCLCLYFLPKHKHLIILAPLAFFLFGNGGTVLVFVPKLDDVKAATGSH
jgi:hypothetical protein